MRLLLSSFYVDQILAYETVICFRVRGSVLFLFNVTYIHNVYICIMSNIMNIYMYILCNRYGFFDFRCRCIGFDWRMSQHDCEFMKNQDMLPNFTKSCGYSNSGAFPFSKLTDDYV